MKMRLFLQRFITIYSIGLALWSPSLALASGSENSGGGAATEERDSAKDDKREEEREERREKRKKKAPAQTPAKDQSDSAKKSGS